MKKNKRHLYKRLPKYALGTMKPIDLGYQPGRGIGSARFETEQNMSLEPETQAIKRSYIPNAIGKLTQYSPYVTEAVKDWTPASSTAASNTATNTMRSTSYLAPSLQNTTTATIMPQAKALSQMSLKLTNPMEAAVTNAASQWNGSLLSSTSSFGSGLSAGLGSSLGSTGGSFGSSLASTGFAGLGEKSAENFFGLSGSSGAGSSASGASAGAGALGIAGKVAAGLGTAIGAYNMYNDIAGFGDHRSASDMMANVGRSHVTTDYGNQYTAYNGVNAGQELAYEKANARAKQLGFGMNAIGTGASIGSFFGPIGTGIGAAAGLLLGGLGSLFGWGDNSEEIERITRLANDNIAMYNRQGESVARSKDVAAEFNNRQGVAAAEGGKSAYGPMKILRKYTPGKNNFNVNPDGTISYGPTGSKIEGQEVTGNPNGDAAIAPGDPKEGDVVNSSITPYDDNFVISNRNPYIKNARNIVKDQSRLDYIIANAGGSKEQQQLQIKEAEKMKKINTNKLMEIVKYNPAAVNPNAYKNGKLPGFWRGTDYLMSAIPHLAAMGASWNQYNRAKHADTHAPSTYVNNAAGAQALNELAQLRFDPTQYLTDAMRAYNQANFQANRMAGLGAGGQAILRNANYQNYLDSLGKIRIAQQDSDNKYRAAHANALAEYGAREQEALINDNIRRFQWQQQQNAAKEGWMAQYEKNRLTARKDLFGDLIGIRQFNRSLDQGDKTLNLYGRQVENDKTKADAELLNAYNNRDRYNRDRNTSSADLIKAYMAINNLYNPSINPSNVLRMIG